VNHSFFEIPAVIVILAFVCFVLIRAFTSPLPRRGNRTGIFMQRDMANDAAGDSSNRPAAGRKAPSAYREDPMRGRKQR
jgi:hypothetical protein